MATMRTYEEAAALVDLAGEWVECNSGTPPYVWAKRISPADILVQPECWMESRKLVYSQCGRIFIKSKILGSVNSRRLGWSDQNFAYVAEWYNFLIPEGWRVTADQERSILAWNQDGVTVSTSIPPEGLRLNTRATTAREAFCA